ncbi:MAG: N-acetylmuramoyl-L-alanine amidase [Oscillibacter sp.]|nr:N-acetylmuramoyl-L-alanine amidase [Oscillibacter sp.]
MAARRRRRRRRRINPGFLGLCAALVLLAVGIGLWWVNRPLPGEDIAVPDYVERDYLLINEFSRPGTPLEEINAVVIHYVGNPGTTAKANRDYFNTLALGREGTYASSHFVVGLEGEVIQCIPLTEVAYASKHRNGDTVAIEVCHPDDTGEFSPETYARVVELTAWLCREFRLDPAEDVIRHYDVTGKECPRWYVANPEDWETLKLDVAAEVEKLASVENS